MKFTTRFSFKFGQRPVKLTTKFSIEFRQRPVKFTTKFSIKSAAAQPASAPSGVLERNWALAAEKPENVRVLAAGRCFGLRPPTSCF